MYKMLAVVFNDEKSAYEGARALTELNTGGSIDVYATAVLQKDAGGWVATKKTQSDFPFQTLAGTAIGGLIGLLGGPAGVAVGSGIGVVAGLIGDTYTARGDFGVSSRELKTDRTAVLARRVTVSVLKSARLILMTAALLCLTPTGVDAATPQNGRDQDPEVQLGKETFDELKVRAEIIESSPLYDQLKPIADAITRAAQPRYNHPFKFYLVHEAQPNAFATPGGNVYVVDSLLYFVRNADELAGTLCHEVSHTIHHDSMELMEKRKKVAKREAGAAILLGPTTGNVLAVALLGQLHSLSYSRDVESRADLTGSEVCAAAGYNPWGLVWLFQDFDSADVAQLPQLLSDHPNNQNRVAALEQHFRENPSVFGKFNPERGSAMAFTATTKAPVVFLR